jgi:hypothetical protein
VTGKRLGGRCPRLEDPEHGSWYFAVQVHDGQPSPTRIRIPRGGYRTARKAPAAREQVLATVATGVAPLGSPPSSGCARQRLGRGVAQGLVVEVICGVAEGLYLVVDIAELLVCPCQAEGGGDRRAAPSSETTDRGVGPADGEFGRCLQFGGLAWGGGQRIPGTCPARRYGRWRWSASI